MRLTEQELEVIVREFRSCFGRGSLYLFGSRTDDSKKGGDVDLYVQLDDYSQAVRCKLEFLVNVKRVLGEQKIDVVLGFGGQRLIDQEALKGILLCKF